MSTPYSAEARRPRQQPTIVDFVNIRWIDQWCKRCNICVVDVASQCIENNGRRVGFTSAHAMLQGYRSDYKAALPGALQLEDHQLGIIKGQPVSKPEPTTEAIGS